MNTFNERARARMKALAAKQRPVAPVKAEPPRARATTSRRVTTRIDNSTSGQKRTVTVEGKPMEFTSGPTIHVQTPTQQAASGEPAFSLEELEALTAPTPKP